MLKFASSGLSALSSSFFSTLFPSDCRICSKPLGNISRLPVCPECLAAIGPIASASLCDVCGENLSSGLAEGSRICSTCQEHRPAFARAVAFGAYEGELRELIHLLKYEQVLPAAAVLGRFLEQAFAKLEIAGPVLVIPVPLYSSKRRQRGFNQAELIGRGAVKQLQANGMHFLPRALVRRRATASQIGLSRPQRAENIRGAFQCLHLNEVSGRTVLLVDDVLTTGTTASECARVLLRAGAKEVLVATVARTLKQQRVLETGPEMELAVSA